MKKGGQVKKTIVSIAAVMAGGLCFDACATDRMPIKDVRPLLVAAINSPSGVAQGVMVGEVVEVMLKRMGSANPIEVDVKTLHDLPQAGCKRLEVITRQKAVIEPGKKLPEDKFLSYKINFCANGRFPDQAIEPEQVIEDDE